MAAAERVTEGSLPRPNNTATDTSNNESPLRVAPEPLPEEANLGSVQRESETTTSTDAAAGSGSWVDQVIEFFTPPDVWSKDRPSLEKRFRYARWSENVPATGIARAASLAWLVVSGFSGAVSIMTDWILERQTRTALFAALVTMAALWAPTRMLLVLVLWPSHALYGVLTD